MDEELRKRVIEFIKAQPEGVWLSELEDKKDKDGNLIEHRILKRGTAHYYIFGQKKMTKNYGEQTYGGDLREYVAVIGTEGNNLKIAWKASPLGKIFEKKEIDAKRKEMVEMLPDAEKIELQETPKKKITEEEEKKLKEDLGIIE